MPSIRSGSSGTLLTLDRGIRVLEEIARGNGLGTARSIGATLQPGDEIVVTRLDHEANVSTWRAMAADRGAVQAGPRGDAGSGRVGVSRSVTAAGERHDEHHQGSG